MAKTKTKSAVQPKNDALVIVYSLFPDKDEAVRMIRKLLRKRLIVCANVLGGVESHYVWQSRLQCGAEVAVWFKTRRPLAGQVKDEIQREHSYKVPLVGEIPLTGVNASYLAWADAGLRTTSKGE